MIFSIVARLARAPIPTVPGLLIGRLLFVTIAFSPLLVVAQSPAALSLPEALRLASSAFAATRRAVGCDRRR